MSERTGKFPVNLFCGLMLLNFMPFLYTLVRTNLIANLPSTDGRELRDIWSGLT